MVINLNKIFPTPLYRFLVLSVLWFDWLRIKKSEGFRVTFGGKAHQQVCRLMQKIYVGVIFKVIRPIEVMTQLIDRKYFSSKSDFDIILEAIPLILSLLHFLFLPLWLSVFCLLFVVRLSTVSWNILQEIKLNEMAANNAIQLGGINANDKLGNDLHNAAKQGNRKRLKKILTTG